jgi:hypothetical protein
MIKIKHLILFFLLFVLLNDVYLYGDIKFSGSVWQSYSISFKNEYQKIDNDRGTFYRRGVYASVNYRYSDDFHIFSSGSVTTLNTQNLFFINNAFIEYDFIDCFKLKVGRSNLYSKNSELVGSSPYTRGFSDYFFVHERLHHGKFPLYYDIVELIYSKYWGFVAIGKPIKTQMNYGVEFIPKFSFRWELYKNDYSFSIYYMNLESDFSQILSDGNYMTIKDFDVHIVTATIGKIVGGCILNFENDFIYASHNIAPNIFTLSSVFSFETTLDDSIIYKTAIGYSTPEVGKIDIYNYNIEYVNALTFQIFDNLYCVTSLKYIQGIAYSHIHNNYYDLIEIANKNFSKHWGIFSVSVVYNF